MILAPSNGLLTNVQAGSLTVAQAFGTWDGTATSAALLNRYHAQPNTARAVNIWRDDWQGNQLLYPTPRTQLCTTTLIASGTSYLGQWNGFYSASVASGYAAPDGSTNAVQITQNPSYSTNPYGIVLKSSVIPTGSFAASAWIRLLSGTANFWLDPDDTGNYKTVAVTSTWQRFENVFPTYAGTELRIMQIVCNDISAGPFQVFAPQMETGITVTGYIANSTAAPLTITDYALSGTTVNLAQAPASTAITTATFYGT